MHGNAERLHLFEHSTKQNGTARRAVGLHEEGAGEVRERQPLGERKRHAHVDDPVHRLARELGKSAHAFGIAHAAGFVNLVLHERVHAVVDVLLIAAPDTADATRGVERVAVGTTELLEQNDVGALGLRLDRAGNARRTGPHDNNVMGFRGDFYG